MSFILDDEKLIQLLTVAGAKHVNKYGQAPTAPNQQQAADYSLANKLLVNLARTVAPNDPNTPKASAPVGIAGGQANAVAGLKPESLRNLGDFLNWIYDNHITWNNEPIVFKTQEEAQASGKDPAIFETDSVKRDRDTETRQLVKHNMYAVKESLVNLLVMLRDSDEATKNRVLKVMISKLINQANDFLEDNEQIDKEPKGRGAVTTLPANMVVDGFRSDVIDAQNPRDGLDQAPTFEGFNIKLTVGHLQDRGRFAEFLRRMKVKNNGKEAFVFDTQNPDPCTAVQILYQRAQYLGSVANDTQVKGYSQAAKLYLKSVVEFGRTFTDKDGRPCSVGAAPAQPGAQVPGAQAQQDLIIQKMGMAVPLSPEDLDFSRIRTFFNMYKQLLQSSTNEAAGPAIKTMNDVEQSMSTASGMTPNGALQVNLAEDPRAIANMLLKPAAQRYVPFLQHLEAIVDGTARVVDNFYAQYGNRLPASQKSLVEAQTRGGNSYAVRNKENIQGLIQARSEVVKFI